MHRLIVLLLFLAAGGGDALFAADKLPAAVKRTVQFSKDVQPIFRKHCAGCHAGKEPKGGLRVDRRANLVRGGESGEPSIVVGNSAKSHLIQLIAGLDKFQQMPPKGRPRVSAKEIAILRAWIDQGAKWPGQDAAKPPAKKLTHWAFQPVTRPKLPAVKQADWLRNPIDAFVLAKLEAAGLTPSPPADRRTLIRRASLVLRGLPPSRQEVQTFLSDRRADAYRRLVDRLLADPRYGERWAPHWLDIARFAETNGFETNTPRPNAWRYRDYVIRAFNSDKPYDRFVREQLAGDALRAGVATGFLVAGAYDTVKSPDVNLTLMQRQDELHDMINATSTAFLGMTVACARCHNHKFDPITQKDYYAFQAVLAGVQHGDRPLPAKPEDDRESRVEDMRRELQRLRADLVKLGLREPVNARRNEERFEPVTAKFVRFTALATNLYEPCLDELEIWSAEQTPRNVALAAGGAKATSSGNYPRSSRHKLEHINDGRYGNSRSWISNEQGKGWVQIELPKPARIDRIVWGRDREQKYKDRLATRYRIEVALKPNDWRTVASSDDRIPFGATLQASVASKLSGKSLARAKELITRIAGVEGELAALLKPALAYAGKFQQPGPTHRLYRGDPLAKRETVVPAAISSLEGDLKLKADAAERKRRLALANWIADGRNPLTPRVMVNRIWQHHFGRGLVATPSDFGKMGVPPSHPELLDWLATEFVGGGWSVKHIQRLILCSNTWRQSSRPRAEAKRIDAASRLLWRFPPRRLEAEAIRDSVLQVTGVLDRRMGGPGFSAFQPNTNYVRVYEPKTSWSPREWRRMVYMTKVRMEQDAIFGTFDCPDAGQVAAKRSRSTTPLQALNLLNSGFMLQQSRLMAERVAAEAGQNVESQVRAAFGLAFGRPATTAEVRDAVPLVKQHGLPAMCRALLNANEFLFLQ